MHPRSPSGPPPALRSLLAEERIALFLDFDGTLVPLAPGPDVIRPLPDLGKRLARLAARVEGRCALISGRAITDIESHIGPVSFAAAGSHGADIRDGMGSVLGDAAQGLPREIEQKLRDFAAREGIDYEHKPHGGALHYRSHPDAGEAARQFARTLAQEGGWAVPLAAARNINCPTWRRSIPGWRSRS